ncbi:proline racemase family protein, partial [Brevibacterium sp.]|uniref:proline racemase family protein n=1 Tax=Brevibacterium sp. TaxID=1701 RepID=UPI0026475BAC
VPSGRVTARVHTDPAGRVTSVDFINVACRLIAADVETDVETDVDGGLSSVDPSRGPVVIDLVWGGALYACVDADRFGLTVTPGNLTKLIALGRQVKSALAQHPMTKHHADDRLSGVYGTIFVNRLGTLPTGELHQRNVTVFADGQVDRSPCGSGTAARLGALHATGELAASQTLVHESIIGTQFRARVLAEADAGDGVIPIIESTAHKVATCTFTVDPHDNLVPGFVLR